MTLLAPALDPAELRRLCLEAGADDVGYVSIDRPELDGERAHLLEALPGTRSLISLVVRMGREAVRSPARSVANHEFHHTGHEVGEIGRRIVRALEERGVRALVPSMGFPMEMDRFPGRIWVVQHKTVAVAAGLGAMGIHRNLIHPRLGNFVLLGTVLVASEIDEPSRRLAENPCLECKLCVAACPVGAIGADGYFDFSACYTHNYREFMGGFTDWVETVAESKNAVDYRSRVTDAESASVWQSLSFGANYKAAYCMAVCPAGEDVLAPFQQDRREFLDRVVKPLQNRSEPVYVMPETDAEAHLARRFPHKTPRQVGNVLRPNSIASFLAGMPHVFQRGRAGDLEAVYHFRFRGDEQALATVTIRAGRLTVEQGLVGRADLVVTADSGTWVRFLRKEVGILRALLTRRVRLSGPARLLVAFGRCFP